MTASMARLFRSHFGPFPDKKSLLLCSVAKTAMACMAAEPTTIVQCTSEPLRQGILPSSS